MGKNIIITEEQLNLLKEEIYSQNDNLSLVNDINVKDGGNFPIKRNGKMFWVSRSVAVILYVYCKDCNNNWYLLSVFRSKTSKWGNRWNVINGYLDYGNTIEETAIKECWEETGVNININNLKYLRTDSHRHGKNGDVDIVYYAVLNGIINDYPPNISHCEIGEIEQAKWIPIEDVKAMPPFMWLDGQGGKAVTLYKKILQNQNTDSNNTELYSLLQNMMKNNKISQNSYNKIIKIISMEKNSIKEMVSKSLKKCLNEIHNNDTPMNFDDIDNYISPYADEINNYIPQDSEGEDESEYAMKEISQIITEIIDRLSDLQEYLNTDKYVIANKEKYAIITNNVKSLLNKIDNIWMEEL